MSNFSIKIDFMKFIGSKKTIINGVKGVFIPCESNKLFVSEKGAVYADLFAIETPNAQYDQTHMVKISGGKDEPLPIVGNIKYAGKKEVTNIIPNDHGFTPETDMPF